MKTIQEPITCAIWHSLQHYSYRDAIFLAERLYAEVATAEALFMLATAYYHSGKPRVVKSLLESQVSHYSPECKLLYAQACWDLEEYSKVECAVTGWDIVNEISYSASDNGITEKIHNIEAEFGDSACYALNLLGRVFLRTERRNEAELCFKASLKLNPFLWTSFEFMCKEGNSPDPREMFNNENVPMFSGGQFFHVQSQKITPKVNEDARNNTKPLTQSNPNVVDNIMNQENSPQSVATPTTLSAVKPNPPRSNRPNTNESSMPHRPNRPITNESSMVTPPSTKVGFGVETSGSLLKNLQSSAIINRDATLPISPDNEFLRSTPLNDHYSEWDSSVDSLTSALSVRRATRSQQRITRGLLSGTAALSPLTPSFGVLPLGDTPSPDRITAMDCLDQPSLKMTTRQTKKCPSDITSVHGKLLFSSTENNRRMSKMDETPPNPSQLINVRRSNRICANTSSSKENAKRRTRFAQPKAPLKKNTRTRQTHAKSVRDLSEEIHKTDLINGDKMLTVPVSTVQTLATQKIATGGLMTLLCELGHAYLALCNYRCKEALHHFNNLPINQLKTAWVLSNTGRAHFELNDYKKAAEVFKELRELHPHYLQGLEIYSTTLWHLQREVELSALAHSMKDFDHLAPETWCAVGNCFSLQQDHSLAATFLHRSIQLDSNFEYAYTLLGHELAAQDDLSGALSCFRSAIRCNKQHYNAWYGIGSIYYRQEKFNLAEIHFRKALSIHPQSSVLLCHIGMTEHSLKKTTAALQTLDDAVALEPRNPLGKFHRATVLLSVDRFDEALQEFTELKKIIPNESLVYFLLGKIYQKMGKSHLALSHFSWARDLDPKGTNNQIKEAIDKLDIGDDDDRYEKPHALLQKVDVDDGGDATVTMEDGGLLSYIQTSHTHNTMQQSDGDESL